MTLPQTTIATTPGKPWETYISRLAGLAQITRLHNCVLGGAFALVGVYLGSETGSITGQRALQAALVVFLCVAFGNVVNDYRDLDADALSKPHRPIPSGRVSQSLAGGLALALAMGALALALGLGPGSGLFALSTLLLSAGYSYFLKSTPLVGNAVIALLDASVVIYGSMAAGNVTAAAWVASLLFFLHVFAHEVLYTVRDQSGDVLAGIDTTATRLGSKASINVFRALALAFMLCAVGVPWLTGIASDTYLFAIVLCSILPTLLALIFLIGNVTARRVLWSLWIMKATWFFSLVPVALLK